MALVLGHAPGQPAGMLFPKAGFGFRDHAPAAPLYSAEPILYSAGMRHPKSMA
jgi:hypothetical protein